MPIQNLGPALPNYSQEPWQQAGTAEHKAAAETAEYARAFDTTLTRIARQPRDGLLSALDAVLVGESHLGPALRDDPGRRGRRDAYGVILGVDPESRRDSAVAAYAAEAKRAAAERQASRPPLGAPCPVIARRRFKLGEAEVGIGDALDLGERHWPAGRLQKLFDNGYVVAQVEHLREVEYALAVNASGGTVPEATDHVVSPAVAVEQPPTTPTRRRAPIKKAASHA